MKKDETWKVAAILAMGIAVIGYAAFILVRSGKPEPPAPTKEESPAPQLQPTGL